MIQEGVHTKEKNGLQLLDLENTPFGNLKMCPLLPTDLILELKSKGQQEFPKITDIDWTSLHLFRQCKSTVQLCKPKRRLATTSVKAR